jgi:putative hemolysin
MDLLILALLIFLNGLFALSEMSIVASKKSRLAAMAEAGDRGAAAALALSNDPNRILATTQLGLTFVTLVEGAFGSHALGGQLAQVFSAWEWLRPWSASAGDVAALALITFATLIFGEMLPKRAALIHPEAIARRIAPGAQKVIRALSPLISALSFCTNRAMALLGLPLVRSEAVSAEDVETMMEAAGQSGLLSERERIIMDNVWRLDERRVGSIMTTRSEIRHIDIARPHEENLDVLARHPRLRLVVTQGGLDNVLGMAPSSAWTAALMEQLRQGAARPVIDWTANLTPALAIPNSLTLIGALESFRSHKSHVALVYSEYGQVEGILTMSDLMDALVGEMPQNAEQELLIHKDPQGKWLIDGAAPIGEAKAALGLGELPGEAQSNYQTAGGFALWMIGDAEGRLPKEFDSFEHEGLVFQIVDVDRKHGYRIDQIMVERKKTPSADASLD